MSEKMSDDVQAVLDLLAKAGIAVDDADVRVLAEKRPKMLKVVNRLRLSANREALLAPAHMYDASKPACVRFAPYE